MPELKYVQEKSAFSLVEIIFTLLIIGVVAAMTIPTLITNQQQESAISKLKKSFSMLNQAITLSEAENGETNTWAFPAAGDVIGMRSWFNTYLSQYMKYYNITNQPTSIIVNLRDGTDLEFEMSTEIDVTAYLGGYNKPKLTGKNVFYYEIVPNTVIDPFRPFEKNTIGTGREKWTTGPYACTRSTLLNDRRYCAGLIIYDGWEISKNYPW